MNRGCREVGRNSTNARWTRQFPSIPTSGSRPVLAIISALFDSGSFTLTRLCPRTGSRLNSSLDAAGTAPGSTKIRLTGAGGGVDVDMANAPSKALRPLANNGRRMVIITERLHDRSWSGEHVCKIPLIILWRLVRGCISFRQLRAPGVNKRYAWVHIFSEPNFATISADRAGGVIIRQFGGILRRHR